MRTDDGTMSSGDATPSTGPGRLAPGAVVQDSYEIERLLGEGGMGATYKARNIANGQPVAIKVMSASMAATPRALDLFRRESTLLGSIRHEAVIRYETMLQDREGEMFLVMEYVEGNTLAHYVNQGARLSSEHVLALGRRLAGGLAAIHALNIVHRDVSPDNILVPGDDIASAKLIDFGLASDTVGAETSIIGNSFAGKVSFCAPEQLGLFGGRVTPATDVYALGLVLMRVAGLPVPGAGEGISGATAARRPDIVVAARGISPALARTLTAMLRADPAERPTDLVALFDQAGPPAVRRTLRPPLVIAGAALAAAVVGGVVYFALFGGGGEAGRSPTEIAEDAVSAADPLAEVRALIDRGGVDNLNAALAALLALGRDTRQPSAVREAALVALAEMYDPAVHDPARSPFAQPDPAAARRYYQQAADLGSAAARDALGRLEE